MKIYVAAKFEQKAETRLAYSKLRLAGHEITLDWTTEDDDKAAPGKLDEYHAECAEKDLEAVLDADALIIYPHDRGKDLYVELGAALAAAIPVICISQEPPTCIFLKVHDVRHVNTIDEAIEVLKQGAAGLHRRAS